MATVRLPRAERQADPQAQGAAPAGDRRESGTTRFAIRSARMRAMSRKCSRPPLPSLLASAVPEIVDLGEELQQIAVSIPEAVKVSRYASPDLLDIPINKLPGSKEKPKLLMFRAGPAVIQRRRR